MSRRRSTASEVLAVVTWFCESRLERSHRPGVLPFYCDPSRTGAFAVPPSELAIGNDTAIFKLFVALSMFQALRDVVIMKQQRTLPATAVRRLGDLAFIRRAIARHPCSKLISGDTFDAGCDVEKGNGRVDCATCPGIPCHVKEATVSFNRMGDMGKLPTSATLRLWASGSVDEVLTETCQQETSPTARAALLVERFAKVHRVGRKLATMFVSALSTPSLAPGLSPWFPEIDGNELVVVDTNVARAADALRPLNSSRTYEARARWVREQAEGINLEKLHPRLPRYSPRVVQEALYAFGSKSNRVANGDACAQRSSACRSCAPTLCPFSTSRAGSR